MSRLTLPFVLLVCLGSAAITASEKDGIADSADQVKRQPAPPVLVDTIRINPDSLRQKLPQKSQTGRTVVVGRPVQEDERVTTARRLMREQQYEAAAALLETIYESNPSDENVANLFRAALLQLKQSDRAVQVLRQQVALHPTNHTYHISLAELLSQSGDRDGARGYYHSALSLVAPYGAYAAQPVIQSMIQYGHQEEAIELIRSLRQESGERLLFSVEEGSLLEKQQRYAEAIALYLPIAVSDSLSLGNQAEKRISGMLAFAESAPAAEAALTNWLSSSPHAARAAFLLGESYLRTDRFAEATRMSLLQDSLSGRSDGLALVNCMRAAERKHAAAPLLEMSALFLERFGSSTFRPSVLTMRAGALVQLNLSREALALFAEAIPLYPPPHQIALLTRQAELQLEQLGDPAGALTSLAMIEQLNGVTLNQQQRLVLARLASRAQFALGAFTEAEQGWQAVVQFPQVPDDVAEEASFHRALISSFSGRLDSAESQLKRLTVQFPRGSYVNDCLRLLAVFKDAADAPPLLQRFLDAEKWRMMHQPDSLAAALSDLIAAEDKRLAPVALLERAQDQSAAGDSSKALAALDQLLVQFPEAFQVPYGLKLKGDILAAQPTMHEQARHTYLDLLARYPNFPYAGDVRKKLRELEGQS